MVVKIVLSLVASSIAWPPLALLTTTPFGAEPEKQFPVRIQYNGAAIVCDEPVHDVGTKWIGPPIEHKFALRNEGVATGWIQIFYAKFGTHRPCVVAIEPGETIYVTFQMRSDKLRGRFEQSATIKLLEAPPVRIEQPWCIHRPTRGNFMLQ